MAEGGAPVTPISKAGVPFAAGTVADPINVTGGTGGGAATIADGADATQGAIADAAVAAGAAGTESAKLRRLTTDMGAVLTKLNASIAVTGTFYQATQPVSGTFWQATQPVSGTFWQATQPVSIAGTVTVTGPLTNNQLRADPVEIQGPVSSIQLPPTIGPETTQNSLSVANSYMTAAALGDGSVNTAESITVANTVQLVEFFNLSANVIWGSWVGTAAANTTGSFPIPALASGVAGYYSAPPGASGTLSIIAVGGASVFTCVGWS